MSLPGPVSFKITECDHYALNKLILRRSLNLPKLALVLAALLAALSIVFNVLLGRPLLDGLVPILVGIFVGGVAAAAFFGSLKPRASKVYRESASLQEEMTLIFEDEGCRIEQLSGLWRIQWLQLVRWDEDRDIFAVFPNRAMAIIVPK